MLSVSLGLMGRIRFVNMPRVLLLLFALCLVTMLFITQCGISFDRAPDEPQSVGHGQQPSKNGPIPVDQSFHFQEVIREKEKYYETEIDRLEQKVANLHMQLLESRNLASVLANKVPEEPDLKNEELYENILKSKTNKAELLHGIQMNNEYELIPFCRFTLSRLYLTDPGLGKRVVEKPIGYKKRDINEVVTFAVEKLNRGRDSDGQELYTSEEFLEGIYRNEPAIGTQYHLYFRNMDFKSTPTKYKQLIVFRPFGPLQVVSSEQIHTKKDVINLILPLSGRIEKFRHFINRFEKVCINVDKRVFLTVVYFGSEGLQEVKSIVGAVSKHHRFKNIKLVPLNEEFSRGRGLQVGAQSWDQGDVLLFLCDVDIVFSTDFLERCRLNTKKGERVYYPIVFSLYNPQVVYSLQDMDIPPESEQLIISKDTGFWRDFGYGMTCQYRSDLLKMKGFDEKIQGWGLEDVYLYRKYIKSNLMVIRATDPGIFHLWHEKYCDPTLPSDQYKGCIRSKALNEASHAQLGMLAFKEEIDEHKLFLQQHKRDIPVDKS